jgi:hypothetical protein
MGTVHLDAMTSSNRYQQSSNWRALAAVFVGVLILSLAWQGSWAQQAPGVGATPQVQPEDVGSPTDPKPRQRIGLPVPKDAKLPTLFLVGDSTVRNGQGNGGGGQWGWGEPLVDYFDAVKINVVNRAIGGLSSRTYMNGPDGDRGQTRWR